MKEDNICEWPVKCVSIQQNGSDYCAMHSKAMGIKAVKEGKVKNPIKPKSDKQKEIDKELKKLYPVFLAEKKFICEIQSPECTKTAVCIHHKKGRGINEVLDVETFMASCTACNGYVESHDTWAREKGFKINIHSK